MVENIPPIGEDKKTNAKKFLPYILENLLDKHLIDNHFYNCVSEKLKSSDVDDFIETAIDIASHPNLLQSNSWEPKRPICL